MQRRDSWTPLAGILAAITFIVGILFAADSPDSDVSAATVLAWYHDHGHRVEVIIGAYLLAFCGLFVLRFASGLRQRLREAEGPDGPLATVALGAALLLVGMLWVGAAALAAVPAAESFGGTPLHSADVARFLPSVGFGAILLFGMFAASALITTTSFVILRSGMLGRWLAWLGMVCGVLLLFGVVFFPMLALPVWLIAASIALARSQPRAEAAAAG